ncbi:hypothetical protein ACWD3D_26660, partial [Streptomyces sp. NPDC002690]
MTENYYEFGTAADRWNRAQLFFDAKEYLTAARILGGLVRTDTARHGRPGWWPRWSRAGWGRCSREHRRCR